MDRSGLRTAVRDRYLDEEIVRIGLRVLNDHVEVALLVEDAGLVQLELGLVPSARAVLLDQPLVREPCLRVLVETPHVGMRRRGVQVVVVLLHVLPVIAFGAAEAEQAFLENRIALVPQRERETDPLLPVGNAGEAVFVPPVRP